ncbi:hypothetical protein [Aliarcobacter cryaerophilus]|uniref:Uncharacterized protein n=1 Tax=Aliarcobacter cryaerophilus TaxID=28198 RepID=A0A2S9TJ06_9BACT|nr:hypothetical protein [Aliarcobacter cryaerophilus]PRM98819.1 hypothetical protein CJ668_10615 [Arcobacter cryaerophilus gv. pseudocryaerophilus]
MHTIKLKVGDGIYNHLMLFLKNLKTNELEIIEDKKINNTKDSEISDISKLSNKSFENIWENKEDEVYDKYL